MEMEILVEGGTPENLEKMIGEREKLTMISTQHI